MVGRAQKVKSPCIGACSTTFGDRVCRGCKRFYFEVDRWNRFSQPERDAVWRRLKKLRMAVLKDVIVPEDSDRILQAVEEAQLIGDSEDVLAMAYLLLRHAASTSGSIEGLGFSCAGPSPEHDPVAILRGVEDRFLTLSIAHYQRYFGQTPGGVPSKVTSAL